jgi:hypothetical protein
MNLMRISRRVATGELSPERAARMIVEHEEKAIAIRCALTLLACCIAGAALALWTIL